MSRYSVATVLTDEETVPTVNGPRARAEGLVIEGRELERGIRQAMARERVASLSDLARRSHVRRDTMYGWFRTPSVRIAGESVEKLVSVLGSQPGDPWHREPTERTLDPETRALLDAAVSRAMDRLGDRPIELLDERLPRSDREGGL